jgi:hypothetical protein
VAYRPRLHRPCSFYSVRPRQKFLQKRDHIDIVGLLASHCLFGSPLAKLERPLQVNVPEGGIFAFGFAQNGADSTGYIFEAAVVLNNNFDPGIEKMCIQKGGSKIFFWGHFGENI